VKKFNQLVVLSSLLVWTMLACTRGEVGVSSKEIRIGQAAALSGPAQGLGKEMQAGAQAYFAAVNATGGVHGRKVRLITLDDGYEPTQTVAATKQLLEEEKVFMLFGYVGTPTSHAAVPLSTSAQTPFFGAFTGAEFLRNPVSKYVYNVRASYYQETEEQVHQLVDLLGKKHIAVFYQADSYGQAGRDGVAKALEKRGLRVQVGSSYERNTTQVQQAVRDIVKAKPDAVIMVGAYKACAAFIQEAKAAGLQDALFLNVSFVGSVPLAQALGTDGDGVIVTQVVPLPWDTSLPLVADYQHHMRQYAPGVELGFGSLEGYLDAKVLVHALRKVGAELTRVALLETLDRMQVVNVDGIKLGFSPTDHQGLDTVYLTVMENGRYKQVPSLRDIPKTSLKVSTMRNP
jgi:branched-chain amino acid transport system substrate-binding protein